ncbi:MAG: hypothetical protein KBG28_26710 [Kofleriaceae bacterium]|nr:hypothetical protein [Kofleriaceae bacterium]
MSEPTTPALFARRSTVYVIVAVAALSLLVAAALTVFGDELAGGGEPAVGPDTYSRSAIGYRGLVALLEQLGVPTVRSRREDGSQHAGLLIIAEPSLGDEAARERLRRLVTGSPRTLIILPKWYGSAEPGEAWVDQVGLIPAAEIEPLFEALDVDESVVLDRSILPVATPVTLRQPQLLAYAEEVVETVDAVGEGTLLAEVFDPPGGGELWILSDPDVANNHGLRHPGNARYVALLIDRLRAGGPVMFDETVHGYGHNPGLVRTLLRFPLALATVQVGLCALLAAWAAMVWFGPRRSTPPPIAPGKDFLIANTAALLLYGGHHRAAVRRYLGHAVAVVRAAVHGPQLAPAEVTRWLDRLAAARGLSATLAGLEAAVDAVRTPAQAIAAADAIHRWRVAMTTGSGGGGGGGKR